MENDIICGKCNKPKGDGKDFCNCGRPYEYDKKFIKKVDKYLKENKDEYEEFIKQSNSDKGYEMYDRKIKVKLPTLEGFAGYIGFTVQTLTNWSEENVEFLGALEKIMTEQKKRLINMGLSGEYNSTIAKLILSSNHGMREKTETDITSKGEKIGYDESQINKIAERISNRERKDSNGGTSSTEASN